MLRRYTTLARRAFIAARYGFLFLGTTTTAFPKVVRLAGRRRRIVAPGEYGHLNDAINIWLDDEYGLRSLPQSPRTILDVGANIGLFSLWATHCFPTAVIHAYEPNRRITPYARANLRDTQVVLFQQGVAADGGRADMVDTRESRLAFVAACPTGDVELAPVADVIARIGGEVDLLKLDCEGGEWDIFRDALSLKRVATIRMEYHLTAKRSIRDLVDVTTALGFSIDALFQNRGFGIAWLSRHD